MRQHRKIQLNRLNQSAGLYIKRGVITVATASNSHRPRNTNNRDKTYIGTRDT